MIFGLIFLVQWGFLGGIACGAFSLHGKSFGLDVEYPGYVGWVPISR